MAQKHSFIMILAYGPNLAIVVIFLAAATTALRRINIVKCPRGYDMYEKRRYTTFCYRFESHHCKSWSQARETCPNEGGDLMIPEGCTYQFFRDLAKVYKGKCEHFWIGGYTTSPGSNYVTVEGDPIARSFPYWSGGQPDGLGGESCLEMRSYFTNFLMNDYHCYMAQGFICQIFL